MDLANRYHMRPCGEFRFQPNDFNEKLAMAVIDVMKSTPYLSDVISNMVKDDPQLEALNAFMMKIHDSIDVEHWEERNARTIYGVILEQPGAKEAMNSIEPNEIFTFGTAIASRIAWLREENKAKPVSRPPTLWERIVTSFTS